MTIFLLGALLLLSVGISFLVWPLLRGGTRAASRDRAIASLYRDQLRELNADHAAGNISPEQFESGRRELERRLLDEIGQPGAAAVISRRGGLTAAVIAAFVLVLPVVLYLALGTPDAIGPASSESQASAGSAPAQGQGAAADNAPHPLTPAQLQGMVDQLAKHLQQSPGDAEGWAMLGRTYSYIRKFPEAVKAFEKAAELQPKDSRLFADYADALAMMQGRSLSGEPMKLVQRALAIDPKDVKALALAGSEAFDRRDYKAAVGYWDRAVKAGPPDAQFAQQLQASLAEARQLAGGGAASPPIEQAAAAEQPSALTAGPDGAATSAGPTITGRVELASGLAGKVAPTDTLFVFARAAQGPRMPVALMRKQVKDLPLQFALDDSMAMMPALKLSNFSTVVIGARVSKSGDAMPSSGDLQGFSGPVKVGSSGVDVRIDQVVP